jgi:NADH dehydrogenase
VPVVVTGASGLVGTALVPRLLEGGSEVRAVVRRQAAADSLRALGAKVAVGDVSNPDLLAAALRDAHTVCHLVGGLVLPEASYEATNLGTTTAALEAARDAGVVRFLFLSYPGSHPSSRNAYLRATGKAEEAVRHSGLEFLIVRSSFVFGRGSRWLAEMVAAARRPLAIVIGPGTRRLAPVFVEDVAAVLAAGDDRAAPVSGTFGLQGPDTVTADELIDLLAGRRRRKVHLTPEAAARATRLLGRPLSRTMLEVLASDSLSDAPDAAAEFGVKLTPLKEGLRAAGLDTV